MDEHTPEEKDLHDLNEVMQAFGVSEWKNLGLAGPPGSVVLGFGKRRVLLDARGGREHPRPDER